MDDIYYKVRDDSGSTVSRAIYMIGSSKDGHKDLLCMYVFHSEGATYGWAFLIDL